MLERAHRADEHDAAGTQAAHAADDVEQLLHPHVRPESGLRDDVLAQPEAEKRRHQRRVAVGDVRERPAVHQARLALERLDQVRLDRVLEQHRHRAGGTQVFGGHGLGLFVAVADGDRPKPPAEILQAGGDRGDRHHLRRGGDVEGGLTGISVRPAP